MKSTILSLLALSLAPLASAGDYAGGKDFVASSGGKDVVDSAKQVCACTESCLTYDFFDVQYLYSDYDGLDTGHGVGLNLSKSLIGQLYLTATAEWSDTGIWGVDADSWGLTAGLGYYMPVNDRLHLNLEAGGLYSNFDSDEYSDDKWGGYVGPGFRYCLSPGMELFANVYYVLFEGGEDLFETNVGIVANITETVAYKVAGLLSEDDQSVMAGLRFYY
ncbi:MAG: outer membrane beta-barrel protein [Verrucomicrobiae bacterium]|nr:outer membrane beta-barrel protein [Verrucomicrobiae bacterium]